MPMTGTSLVSRYSLVRPMSRIDLQPALMTPTLVRPNSSRSAETSIDSSPPLLTPPMPPVAMNRMPAIDAHRKIAAIVKPALSPFTMA